MVFPLGQRERAPNDRLGHKVASLLLSPSETRDRLTRGVYKKATKGYWPGIMEELLPDVIAADPVERKLLKAERAGQVTGYTFEERLEDARKKSILTEKEADLLADVRKRSLEIIATDDFDIAELQAGLTDKGDAIRDKDQKAA